jgi:hypothetical protein
MKWLTFNKTMAVITAIVLLSCCTKFGKNMTVKGEVLNPITGEGYSGVTVEMIQSEQSLSFNGGYKGVTHTLTDENGNFSISATRLAPVWVQVQAEDYKLGWDYKGQYSFMLKVNKGKTMNLDYHIVPYGGIKLKINNINCEGGGDTMYFRKKWAIKSNDFDYWSSPRIGCYSYDGEPFKLPMGEYIYETKVTRSGVVSYVYDTVFVPKTGVVTLQIDY